MFKVIADILVLSFLKAFIGLLGVVPEKFGKILARAFLGLFFLSMPRIEKVALKNLEIIFPEKPLSDRHRIYRESLWALSENLYGFSKIRSLTPEWVKENIDFSEIDDALSKAKVECNTTAVLLPTLHVANSELAIQGGALFGLKTSILARGFGLQKTDRWVNNQRELWGNKMFSRKGGFNETISRLNGGERVVLLVDQNVKRNHAVFVDFFGMPAATTKTVAYAALRTQAPIIFSVPVRLTSGKIKFTAERILVPSLEHCEREEAVAQISRSMNEAAEKVISAYPEQWFWIHRRFKTRPEGEPETVYSS